MVTIDETPQAALISAAGKELAYLKQFVKQFGRPLLPFRRMRREAYQYQVQSPANHVENLQRFLLIASSLVPKDPVSTKFHIRHPYFQASNIMVSRSSDSSLEVVGMFDWQHASILPLFLLAGIPNRFQNYDDPVSDAMDEPSLPENLDDMGETQQSRERELFRRRLVHYHYLKSTYEHNMRHFVGMYIPEAMLRRRLFSYASDPWEGETLALKVALIEAAEKWETFADKGTPCPIAFDAEDKRKAMELNEVQIKADETLEACWDIIGGYGPEGWVPAERYEVAVERGKQMRAQALAQVSSDEERAEVLAHWPFDDMDEDEYM